MEERRSHKPLLAGSTPAPVTLDIYSNLFFINCIENKRLGFESRPQTDLASPTGVV